MQFSKMHGAGNDYVYVNCFEEPVPNDPSALARAVSDRHFGIGSDGLVLVLPDSAADAEMRMYNADGSAAEMCGNALRCVGWMLRDRGLVDGNEMRIRTGRGILDVVILRRSDRSGSVQACMGVPAAGGGPIPADLAPPQCDLDVDGRSYRITTVSMGNPHCVLFITDVDAAPVHDLGPRIETHAAFPDRTNVEFVQVVTRDLMRVRVWERGSGETLACGTGAAAAVVAGVLNGTTDRRCTVSLPGGDLIVDWPEDGPVRMTGPVVEVYRGAWPDSSGAT